MVIQCPRCGSAEVRQLGRLNKGNWVAEAFFHCMICPYPDKEFEVTSDKWLVFEIAPTPATKLTRAQKERVPATPLNRSAKVPE